MFVTNSARSWLTVTQLLTDPTPCVELFSFIPVPTRARHLSTPLAVSILVLEYRLLTGYIEAQNVMSMITN